MLYFAHTRKACGLIAVALFLSACGEEETAQATDQSGSQDNVENLAAADPQQSQSTASAEFWAANAQGSPGTVTFSRGSSTSAPGAPVQGTLDKTTVENSSSVSAAPANESMFVEAPAANEAPAAEKLLPGTPSQPARDLGDQLPVTPPATDADPIVTLIANTQGSLNSAGTKLEWSTQNVESCQASGAWVGQVNTNGSRDLDHETSGEHTYMLTCQGAAGTAMAMVTVAVESTALAWQAPAQNTNGTELTDLAGYNLYYGSESGRYTETRTVSDASQTALELPVEPGTYYLAMTAYDRSGNESELSNEIVRIVN